MKKIICFVLLLSLFCAALAGSGESETSDNVSKESSAASEAVSSEAESDGSSEEPVSMTANVLTISGPTGMGMAQMMKQDEDGESRVDYTFTVTESPADVMTAIVSGQTDIAACPINLAAKIWNKTEGGIQILAVNTLGVLYVVTNGAEINSFADLDGKTVIASGEGASPEYAFKFLCEYFSITVDLQFVDTFATASAMVAGGEAEIALLAEPSVSSALLKNPDLKVSLDITEIWSGMKHEDDSPYEDLVQGCVIVRKEFAESHPETVEAFLADYEESVTFANKTENLDTVASYIETYGILPKAAIAKKALPKCNIVFLKGNEMKTIVEENLAVLFHFTPASVGGKLPEAAFYYGAEN